MFRHLGVSLAPGIARGPSCGSVRTGQGDSYGSPLVGLGVGGGAWETLLPGQPPPGDSVPVPGLPGLLSRSVVRSRPSEGAAAHGTLVISSRFEYRHSDGCERVSHRGFDLHLE